MDLQLVPFLKTLQGKSCWSFIGGPGTGSMISLAFGAKIPRKRPISNPCLTTEQQNYVGEIGLFIQDAAWRIDSRNSVVCSSTSSNEPGGPFEKGQGLLLNRQVIHVDVSHPGLDLTLEFDQGATLRVFCDQANFEDHFCNYSVHLKESTFSVGAYSNVICENKPGPIA